MTEPTGHLETYTLLRELEHHQGDSGSFLRWQHNMYNAGMMIKATVYYYKTTGKTRLLEVAIRCMNYTADYMGPAPEKSIAPSHSGLEEVIIKLY